MTELLPLLISQAQPSAQDPSCAGAVAPIVLMLGVFYFFIVLPQRKQEQSRQDMIRRLSKGDSVITSGGLIGEIYAVKDHEFVVEVSDKVRVRVARDDVDPYEPPSQSTESK